MINNGEHAQLTPRLCVEGHIAVMIQRSHRPTIYVTILNEFRQPKNSTQQLFRHNSA